MPRVSTYSGIVIAMYYRDHHPPHFHAISGGHEAKLVIETGEPLGEPLPPQEMTLVQQWLQRHRLEVRANWAKGEAHLPLDPIEPRS
jgi:hypothetical protein